MINAKKIMWHGLIKTLGSSWRLWVTRFPTHLAWYSSKLEHMGSVTLLDSNIVSNIIYLSKEVEWVIEGNSHGRGRD